MINTMEFPLKGRHNLLNAMAASTVAHLLDVSKETIRESLLNFKGAPHRLEPVLKIQNISTTSTTQKRPMLMLSISLWKA